MNMEKIDALIDDMADDINQDAKTTGYINRADVSALASLIQARAAAENAEINTKKEK